jgi:hypothetical protein
MHEKTSGCSSGRFIRLLGESDGWAWVYAVAKKGDTHRMSLWAAKRRLSAPTLSVTTAGEWCLARYILGVFLVLQIPRV